VDEHELHDHVRGLVDELAPTAPDLSSWASIRHYLDFGEPGEAMDLLVAALVRAPVPVTPQQRDRVRHVIESYDLDPADHRFFGDRGMVERLTVVDPP
jgi:hypothetical protein